MASKNNKPMQPLTRRADQIHLAHQELDGTFSDIRDILSCVRGISPAAMHTQCGGHQGDQPTKSRSDYCATMTPTPSQPGTITTTTSSMELSIDATTPSAAGFNSSPDQRRQDYTPPSGSNYVGTHHGPGAVQIGRSAPTLILIDISSTYYPHPPGRPFFLSAYTSGTTVLDPLQYETVTINSCVVEWPKFCYKPPRRVSVRIIPRYFGQRQDRRARADHHQYYHHLITGSPA